MKKFLYGIMSFLGLVLMGCASLQPTNKPVSLTLFHNNDGESSLTSDEFGNVASFVTLSRDLRSQAEEEGRAVLNVSSGDNFLSGPAFSASQYNGVYYDAIVLSALDYDAIDLGNHDFDFGPDVLADFIKVVRGTYLSSNLDFTGEPDLDALKKSGRIASSVIVKSGGQSFGIVGAVTPELHTISSPRGVRVLQDVQGIIQKEVDALVDKRVNKIILISHLQGLNAEIDLASKLVNVDAIVGGGGDELLSNEGDLLLPEDEENVPFGPYPIIVQDAEGRDVPIVTTPGEYKYIGALQLEFDAEGHLITTPSGKLYRVASPQSGQADAVAMDPVILKTVVEPVKKFQEDLSTSKIAETQVRLDGTRELVRTRETNYGDLVADSILWQARKLAGDFNVEVPSIVLQNGGSIRKSLVLDAGSDFTELQTFDSLPFSNFVVVVPDVSPERIKLLLENAISRVEDVSGRFAQVSGLNVVYDTSRTPLVIDTETGKVTQDGSRVRDVVLEDGTVLVRDGVTVNGAPSIAVATVGFTARGGDQYPFDGAPYVSLGVTYRDSLANYLKADRSDGGLGGIVTSADYPEEGNGRIVIR